jgi:hypothetical protein
MSSSLLSVLTSSEHQQQSAKMSQEPTRKNKRKSMGGDATASGSGSGSGVKVSVLEPSASAGPVFGELTRLE